MKSSIFILSILLIAATSIAQDKYVGIKSGMSISSLIGDGVDYLNKRLDASSTNLDENNLYWFTGGFFTTKEILPDLFSIQSEFLYVRHGKQWEITSDGKKNNVSLEVDYIQFPWLVKLSLPVWLRPNLYTGASISIMLRSRIRDLPSGVDTIAFFNQTQSGEEVFEYATNVIDLGLVSGIDVTFPLGPGYGVIDFRFNLGGLNVFNFPQADKIRSYDFLIMAGYGFNFGGGY